jgi:hypothetical protein
LISKQFKTKRIEKIILVLIAQLLFTLLPPL